MDIKVPQNIALANLPTPVEKLGMLSQAVGKEIWIKRDDYTGLDWSGNKIRKLEYSIAEALRRGCDTLITCGGLQSNHCRATAAASARLGLSCILLLRGEAAEVPDGNSLLDTLYGARIEYISSEDYSEQRGAIMEAIREAEQQRGRRAYIIPEGASNGIGTFGYVKAMAEIAAEEGKTGPIFDTIVATVGSGGTLAGLALGNKELKLGKRIVGFNIAATAEHFNRRLLEIGAEFAQIAGGSGLTEEDFTIIDGYVGLGYALNVPEELRFIRDFARDHGIVLDPVYTGKAMGGLTAELLKGSPVFRDSVNILFIHTGGMFGVFPKKSEFMDALK